MHNADEQAWDRDDIFQEIQVENVADHIANRRRATFALVIRHPDVSSTFSIGPFYLPGSPGGVLEALTAAIPELLRHLEIGIPDTRSATLSSTDFWDAVYREELIVAHMVRSGGITR